MEQKERYKADRKLIELMVVISYKGGGRLASLCTVFFFYISVLPAPLSVGPSPAMVLLSPELRLATGLVPKDI